eukprot:6209617-Pleurochrysis_carterae.AAC.4
MHVKARPRVATWAWRRVRGGAYVRSRLLWLGAPRVGPARVELLLLERPSEAGVGIRRLPRLLQRRHLQRQLPLRREARVHEHGRVQCSPVRSSNKLRSIHPAARDSKELQTGSSSQVAAESVRRRRLKGAACTECHKKQSD